MISIRFITSPVDAAQGTARAGEGGGGVIKWGAGRGKEGA